MKQQRNGKTGSRKTQGRLLRALKPAGPRQTAERGPGRNQKLIVLVVDTEQAQACMSAMKSKNTPKGLEPVLRQVVREYITK